MAAATRQKLVAVAAAVLLAACGGPADLPDDGGARGDPAPRAPEAVDREQGGESPTPAPTADPQCEEYPVPAGSRPHDVAPGPNSRVWFTGQRSGQLGVLDPETGAVRVVPLGEGSAPHGVIVGPDGAPWVTDGGLNAIVTVDPEAFAVTTFPLPGRRHANLNTATFAGDGQLWFTGQAGVHGRVDPQTGDVAVHDSPRGAGPCGITTARDGQVWFSSLAGSYIARVAGADGAAELVDVPSPDGGARRIWSDSSGGLWVTEWFAGSLARYRRPGEVWGAGSAIDRLIVLRTR